jgi:hypothetical protein
MKITKTAFALILIMGLSWSPCVVTAQNQNELPPGTQKKMERSGELPYGMQRKYKKGEILDRKVFEQSFIIEPENRYGVVGISVDNKTIRVIRSTREIVDIVDSK